MSITGTKEKSNLFSCDRSNVEKAHIDRKNMIIVVSKLYEILQSVRFPGKMSIDEYVKIYYNIFKAMAGKFLCIMGAKSMITIINIRRSRFPKKSKDTV